jgi:hypothetical protein
MPLRAQRIGGSNGVKGLKLSRDETAVRLGGGKGEEHPE